MINRKPTIKEVIVSLVGDKAGFYFEEGVITEWFSETLTQPSQSAIDAEMARLQAEYDNAQYSRDRAKAYPSLADQADMQYWDSVNGTTTWADAITAVKEAHPKP